MISFSAIATRAASFLALKVSLNLSAHRLLIFSRPGVMTISSQLPIKQLIFAKCVCGKLP
jgi:hypothetical protein